MYQEYLTKFKSILLEFLTKLETEFTPISKDNIKEQLELILSGHEPKYSEISEYKQFVELNVTKKVLLDFKTKSYDIYHLNYSDVINVLRNKKLLRKICLIPTINFSSLELSPELFDQLETTLRKLYKLIILIYKNCLQDLLNDQSDLDDPEVKQVELDPEVLKEFSHKLLLNGNSNNEMGLLLDDTITSLVDTIKSDGKLNKAISSISKASDIVKLMTNKSITDKLSQIGTALGEKYKNKIIAGEINGANLIKGGSEFIENIKTNIPDEIKSMVH